MININQIKNDQEPIINSRASGNVAANDQGIRTHDAEVGVPEEFKAFFGPTELDVAPFRDRGQYQAGPNGDQLFQLQYKARERIEKAIQGRIALLETLRSGDTSRILTDSVRDQLLEIAEQQGEPLCWALAHETKGCKSKLEQIIKAALRESRNNERRQNRNSRSDRRGSAFRCEQKPWMFGDIERDPGLYEIRSVQDAPAAIRIGDPLVIDSHCHDEHGDNHAVVVTFDDKAGTKRKLVIPITDLLGAGDALIRLGTMGYAFNFDQRQRIPAYLNNSSAEQWAIGVRSTGWVNHPKGNLAFAHPQETLGADDVVYITATRLSRDTPQSGGSFDEWRSSLAAKAQGNPILQLAMMQMLSTPLLRFLPMAQSGIIHLHSGSSQGKTSILQSAASIWGHGKHCLPTWNSTANAVEGRLAQASGMGLALDEIGQADGRSIAKVIYAWSNETGKGRMTVTTDLRETKTWQVQGLSSGEKTPAGLMQEAGLTINAGQEIRMVSVPTKRRYGAFDTLHDADSGAEFADGLRIVSEQHYGHAGLEFVRQIISTAGDSNVEGITTDLTLRLNAIQEQLLAEVENAGGQTRRVAARFAVAALAGELATQWNILPWPVGEAVGAAKITFDAWREDFGETPAESRNVLDDIRRCIERYGRTARFRMIGRADIEGRVTPSPENQTHIEQFGWVKPLENGLRAYYFTDTGLEAAVEYQKPTETAKTLLEAGWLTKGKSRLKTLIRTVGDSREYLYKVQLPEGPEGNDEVEIWPEEMLQAEQAERDRIEKLQVQSLLEGVLNNSPTLDESDKENIRSILTAVSLQVKVDEKDVKLRVRKIIMDAIEKHVPLVLADAEISADLDAKDRAREILLLEFRDSLEYPPQHAFQRKLDWITKAWKDGALEDLYASQHWAASC